MKKLKKIFLLLIITLNIHFTAIGQSEPQVVLNKPLPYYMPTNPGVTDRSVEPAVDFADRVEITFRFKYKSNGGAWGSYANFSGSLGGIIGNLPLSASTKFNAVSFKNYGGQYEGGTDEIGFITGAIGNFVQILPAGAGGGNRNVQSFQVRTITNGSCFASPTIGGFQQAFGAGTIGGASVKKNLPVGQFMESVTGFTLYYMDKHLDWICSDQNYGNCAGSNNFNACADDKIFYSTVSVTLVLWKACNLPAPSNLNNLPVANAPKSQILSWSNLLGNSGYEVEWALVGTQFGSGSGGNATTAPNQIQLQLNNLTGTDYQWRVRTKCSSGSTSLWSLISMFNIDQCVLCGSTDAYNKNSVVEVVTGQPVNIDDWVFAGPGWVIDERLVKTTAVPEFTWTGRNASFPIGTSQVKFKMRNVNTGQICCLPEITIIGRDCNQCFVDDSAGNNVKKYYCLPQPISNYAALHAKYNCNTQKWSMSTLDSNGNPTSIGGSFGNVSKPENLRPACKSCGGLAANTYVFKYLMPKSNGASQQMDYIILPNDPTSTVQHTFRNKTTNDQAAGTTTLITEYKAGDLGNWKVVYRQDLGSNMANAPGSPNAYGFYLPNHEYFSTPTNICTTNWSTPASWSERANLGGVEADCRTFIRPLIGNSNELFRVRLCNPCNILGFFAIGESKLTLSTDANLSIAGTQKMGGNSTSYSSTGMVNIYLETDNAFLGCSQQGKIASAISLKDLEGNCASGENSRIAENNKVPEELILSKNLFFPNPFTTELNIKFTASGSEETYFEVFDLQGKKMYNSKAQKLKQGSFVQETVDTASWAAGMYIIKNYGGNGESNTQKIIKQ